MGAWCLTGELLKNIPLSGGNERVLIAGADGTCVSSAGPGETLQGAKLDLSGDYFVDSDGKEYIQLAAKSEVAGIYVVDIVDKSVIIGSLRIIENVILVLSVVLILLLAGTYIVFYKILNQPVRWLVAVVHWRRSLYKPPVMECIELIVEEHRDLAPILDEISGHRKCIITNMSVSRQSDRRMKVKIYANHSNDFSIKDTMEFMERKCIS